MHAAYEKQDIAAAKDLQVSNTTENDKKKKKKKREKNRLRERVQALNADDVT